MRAFDVVLIAAYFAGVAAVGLRYRSREADADDYFVGQGGFRGWIGTTAVGLSIAATLLSGLSFITYPSTAYSDGAAVVLGVIGMPLVWLALRYWFLPRYLRPENRHPYEILQRRFGTSVRLAVSGMFILLRIGWMGLLLAAPTRVILGACNLGPEWFWPAVLAVGLGSTAYTAVGGIRSVIYTDALQFLVMGLGAVFIIGFTLAKLGMPLSAVAAELHAGHRLDIFDFSLSLAKPFTFWAVAIGLTTITLSNKFADLMMLQRYMAAESPAAAARSVGLSIWGTMAVIVSLVVMGLLLWAWYRHHPDPGLPAQPDQVLAYFIARELPAGLSGLLIAALLAATMSSMTSGVAALAGVITSDWIARFGRKRSAHELFVFDRRLTIVIGVVATLFSGMSAGLGTLFQASQKILGLFLGPMLGCMVLAVGGVRLRPGDVLAGMAAGLLAGGVVAGSWVSALWVTPVAAAVTLVLASLVSLLRRPVVRTVDERAAKPSRAP